MSNSKVQQLQKTFLLVFLIIRFSGYGQEALVFPSVEHLYPNLTDPSFVGEQGRTQITAFGQSVLNSFDRSTLYVNAQLPIFDQNSFGIDFSQSELENYMYSQFLLSTAFEIRTGGYSHIKVGLAGGGERLLADRAVLNEQRSNEILSVNENNISFTYRIGVHFNSQNIRLGFSYITLPLQQILVDEAQDDILRSNLEEVLTGYVGYSLNLGKHFTITPMFRYINFTDKSILEGSLMFNLRDVFDISLAYKNNYSINPAMQVHLFKTLALGYSYQKAIGKVSFDDVHSLGLSLKFSKSTISEEPEWMETAKRNINMRDKIANAKPKKKIKKTVKETVATEKEPTKRMIAQPPTKKFKNTVAIVMSSRYYVVVKSFYVALDAYTLKEKLKKSGLNALVGTINRNDKYYVFVDSDFEKNKADKLLTRYKRNEKIPDTSYVLKVE